jgi:hypothetical protein
VRAALANLDPSIASERSQNLTRLRHIFAFSVEDLCDSYLSQHVDLLVDSARHFASLIDEVANYWEIEKKDYWKQGTLEGVTRSVKYVEQSKKSTPAREAPGP